MKTEIKKLPKSQLEISFELEAEEFDPYISKALEHFKKHVKMDGFRPGQAPLKMVEQRVGVENVLMEAGDAAVQESYITYTREQKLEVVGNPEIKIEKIAKGNPFIFKATVTILPDVALPNYKEIAKDVKITGVAVTDEEVQHAINHLQKSRAKMALKNDTAAKKDFVEISYQNPDINDGKEIPDQFILGEGGFMPGFEDQIVGMKAGEEKTFSIKFPENINQKNLAGKDGKFTVVLKSVHSMELPEISDEFAKQLGGFDTLVKLKENITEGMLEEKRESEKQQRRSQLLEKIAAKATFDIPEAVVETEKKRLLDNFKQRITEQFKMTFEEYLSSIKRSEKEIYDSYQKEAEKRLAEFLILRQIGKEEKVEVADQEVEEEIKKAVANYSKDEIAKIDILRFKEYTQGVIFNEKIFKLLEDLAQ